MSETTVVQPSQVLPKRRVGDDGASPAAEAVQGVSQLERTLLSIPVADRARIAAIKRAVLDGKYQVDADAVAERMVEIEQQLDGSGR